MNTFTLQQSVTPGILSITYADRVYERNARELLNAVQHSGGELVGITRAFADVLTVGQAELALPPIVGSALLTFLRSY